MMDRVLPVEDEDISAFARKAFEKQGMKILTSATVKGLRKKAADNVTVSVEQCRQDPGDHRRGRVISAVGIVGNVENIGLEGTKVKVERTHVVTDGYVRDRRTRRLCDRRSHRGRPGSRTRPATRA